MTKIDQIAAYLYKAYKSGKRELIMLKENEELVKQLIDERFMYYSFYLTFPSSPDQWPVLKPEHIRLLITPVY